MADPTDVFVTDISDVSFYLPDIIIESVLREGIEVIKRNPNLVDHIFRSLAHSDSKMINAKYGKKELERIKSVLLKYDWSFVHSFNEVEGKVPCVSIQLMTESEAKEVNIEDFEQDATLPLEEGELAALVVIPSFTPTGYNDSIGAVFVADSVDLTNVHQNLLFVDASQNEFNITGGIVETSGLKQFMIAAGSGANIAGVCSIKSAIDFKQVTIRSTMVDVNLLLGVHTKDALMTKYFYIILKYILMARKAVLIDRGFDVAKYQGSDFTRNLKIEGDAIFNRFLTLTGKVKDSFRSDETTVFDAVDVIVQVPQDVATTQDLGLQDSTIQIGPPTQDE